MSCYYCISLSYQRPSSVTCSEKLLPLCPPTPVPSPRQRRSPLANPLVALGLSHLDATVSPSLTPFGLIFISTVSKIFLLTRQGLGLVFVAAAGPLVSGALKLLALGTQDLPVHLLVFIRTREQASATALGRVQAQLVEGEDLAPGLGDDALGAAAPGAVHTPSVWYLLVRHIID